MEKIKTKSCNILCVEVPEECLRIQNIDYPDWYLYDTYMGDERCDLIILYGKSGTLQKEIELTYGIKDLEILGKLSELTDEDCEEFVELLNDNFYIEEIKCWSGRFYYHYNQVPGLMNQLIYTAKQSFITLLQSEGIDTSNEDKLLIIKII